MFLVLSFQKQEDLRTHMKKITALLLTACLLLACLAGCGAQSADDGDTTSVTAGSINISSGSAQTVEAESTGIQFEAHTIEGEAVTSDIFGDSSLTMVNVWATYCDPCLNEMPYLGELASEYDAGQFQIIGIISDVMEGTATELAEELITQTGADYLHLLLNESIYYALLTDVSAVPTTFFVDQDGNILGTYIGSRDKSSWEGIINALLAAV